MTPMRVIRAKCLECCGGSWRDVKFCTAGSADLADLGPLNHAERMRKE